MSALPKEQAEAFAKSSFPRLIATTGDLLGLAVGSLLPGVQRAWSVAVSNRSLHITGDRVEMKRP